MSFSFAFFAVGERYADFSPIIIRRNGSVQFLSDLFFMRAHEIFWSRCSYPRFYDLSTILNARIRYGESRDYESR
jgi:hypothetical protein